MRTVSLLLVFVFFALQGTAQRLYPGQKSFIFTGGIPLVEKRTPFEKKEYIGTLAFSQQRKNQSYTSLFFSYRHNLYDYKATIDVPTDVFMAGLGYMHPLFHDYGRFINVYAGLWGFTGYEMVNEGKRLLPDGATLLTSSRFVYGGIPRISIESYLARYFALVATFETSFFFNTRLDFFRPSVNIGGRINF